MNRAGGKNEGNETIERVPAPSLEADIRTMVSDIEMMGKTGGVSSQSETIWISGADVTESETSSGSTRVAQNVGARESSFSSRKLGLGEEPHVKDTSRGKAVALMALIVLGVAALFLAGFFLYPVFFGGT